jgi:hypothetical protein
MCERAKVEEDNLPAQVDTAEVRKLVDAYFAKDPEVVPLVKESDGGSPEMAVARMVVRERKASGQKQVKDIRRWY